MNEHATIPAGATAGTLDDMVTVHLYPQNPRYRRSGHQRPQPGDVALCGWVKQSPHQGLPAGSENCLMCIRLLELGR